MFSATVASVTKQLKEHPMVVLASISATGVITLAHFLGALHQIRAFFPSQDPTAASFISPRDGDAAFSPVTFEEYVHNAMTYSGTNQTRLQQKEYIGSLRGKRVIWRGNVLAVDAAADGYLEVVLAHQSRFARFLFPASDRIQLMALKPFDRVEISGVIDEWDVEEVSLQNSKLLSFTHSTSN